MDFRMNKSVLDLEEPVEVRSDFGVEWLMVPESIVGVLRVYQHKTFDEIRIALEDCRHVLLQSPTGSGKSHLIGAVVAAAEVAGLSVLILATRTRIVWQLHERLEAFQIDHGVIAAALPALNYRAARVQVASVDTLYRRALVDCKVPLPSADVVIFDEAHLALGQSRIALLERYPKAIHLGFTATPAKVSGRPLSERFDKLIIGPSVKELIASGDLVRARIFAAPAASESELAAIDRDSKTGDYVTGQIGELMARPKLIGDVVQNWLRIANGKRTIVFACTQAHGAALAQEFLQAGVPAELLTDQDAEADREAAIYRLETGRTQLLINCFLLSYGVDIPSVECIVLARPTRSVTLYLQAVGRGMRPAPGKDSVIIIDHGRVVETLGMPDADFAWSLADDGNVNFRARGSVASRSESDEYCRTCPECQHMWLVSEDGPACQCCGWLPAQKLRAVAFTDAELREINAAAAEDAATAEKFYREALGWYSNRWPDRWREREKRGRWWAWQQTRERFDLTSEHPPGRYWSVPATAPGPETSGWLRSRQIAYNRARATA
jgi:DNA repair protein RadD